MKKNFHQHGLKVFVGYYGPHWKMFAIDMLCAIIASVVDLVFPYISRNSMQTLLPQGLFGVFFAVMGIMIVAYLLKALLYYIITVVGHRMGTLVEADMRSDIFSHMQSLSFSFFDHNRTGKLMSRVTTELLTSRSLPTTARRTSSSAP